MSLYQCTECGCRENTACGYYWEANYKKEPVLCSECHTGEWHGHFPKKLFPKGQFETNSVGNLQHKETGETDLKKYEITA